MSEPSSECPMAEQAVLLALHALDPTERDEVAHHVRSCPECQAIVDDVEETFAAVGAGAATAPPPHLRDRVLAATARDDAPAPVRPLRPAAARRSGRRRRWATLAAAAVLLAGLVGGGIAVAQLNQQREAASAHAGTVDELLAAIMKSPHAVLVDRSRHPVAAVVLGDAPRFYALDLPAPDAGEAWVLWGMRGRAATALGALPPDAGSTGADVPVGRLGQFEAYALTQEPAGPLPARPGGELAASGPVVAAGA
jgi:Anti-sigma-K factor rskA, C-terminal